MELRTILQLLKEWRINSTEALSSLAAIGMTPSLYCNEKGQWAVSFTGLKQKIFKKDPKSIAISCFIGKDDWKNSIQEALVYILEEYEKKGNHIRKP